MAEMRSGIVLGNNEKLVMELEAELWASSSNPIARFFGTIKRFIGLLLGFKRKGFVVITDKRVVETIQFKGLWIFNIGKNVKYLLPSSVKEVGYVKEGTCFGCFCQSYSLYYDAFTQRTSVLLTSADCDEDAQKVVDAFYAAVFSSQNTCE